VRISFSVMPSYVNNLCRRKFCWMKGKRNKEIKIEKERNREMWGPPTWEAIQPRAPQERLLYWFCVVKLRCIRRVMDIYSELVHANMMLFCKSHTERNDV
jgi:hypothetical protein